MTVDGEHIEGDEDGRASAEQELAELGPPRRVEAYHFSVEDSGANTRRRPQLGGERGEAPEGVAIFVRQFTGLRIEVGEVPKAIVLELVEPFRVVKRLADSAKQHRREAGLYFARSRSGSARARGRRIETTAVYV